MIRNRFKTWLACAIIYALVPMAANASTRHRPSADSYQAPDGTYYSLADEVRSLRGTPCGIECEKRHERELQNRYGSDAR
jgi:hypothetical protein